jgi:hypothetical protein
MASTTILNAAPMTIMRGVQDLSARTLNADTDQIPTHLPKVYIYAEKGPTSPQLVAGSSRTNIYGSNTFDLRKPYANHQTVLSNVLAGAGNAQMIERILPGDVGPRSNLLLSLDVLPTEIVQYERNANGSIQKDPVTGLPVPVVPAATMPGYSVKWVITNITDIADEENFGNAQVGPGDRTTTGVDPTQSTRYPILELQASSYGQAFDNSGIRLSAPTETSAVPLNVHAMAGTTTYPFRLSVIRRATASDTPRPVETQFAEQYIDFTFKPGTINPITDARFTLSDIFLKSYQNIENNGYPIDFGDFGAIKVYEDNIGELLQSFYLSESLAGGMNTDFLGGADEQWLFNFVSGISSKGEPYYTYEIDTSSEDSVRLTESTNLFAKGGFDGTMTDADFASAVAQSVAEYANPNSPLLNSAVNVESIIYDTGFPLATKRELCKFISERKDTFVVLSTYDVNGGDMSAADEHSVAIALKTYLQMFPESDYFGTSTMRGLIMGRYGSMTSSQYQKKLPLTIELAYKAAKMMGSSDGKWREGAVFDRAPNNEISLFEKVNVTYTPAAVRNKDWTLGLNWVQAFSRSELFFPALKTVYDEDTSVLNSFFVAMCCVELQKVGERVWREYTGSVRLTNAQLVDRVNSSVQSKTIGRFCDMFKVVPAAYFTAADTLRGYSWTLPIKLYANNMETVMTLDIQTYRMADFNRT